MSQHAEDEPTVRVRRKTVLPACYDEYDLTGFTLLKPVAQPMSPPTHSSRLDESDDQEEGATGFTPVLPAYEADSPLPWSDDEQESASDVIRRENKDLRRALQMIQQERDKFQTTNDQYATEPSQLKQQMRQLQIRMEQQHPGSQSLSAVAPPRQHSSSHPVPAPHVHPYQLNASDVKQSIRLGTSFKVQHTAHLKHLPPLPNRALPTITCHKGVRFCHRCQLNDPIKTVVPVLHSIKVKEPREVLGLDLIGPLPETARNKKFILTMTDLYTKHQDGQQIEQSPELFLFDTTIVPHKTRLSLSVGSQRQASMSPGRVPVLTTAKPHSLPASAQLFTTALPTTTPHAVRPPADGALPPGAAEPRLPSVVVGALHPIRRRKGDSPSRCSRAAAPFGSHLSTRIFLPIQRQTGLPLPVQQSHSSLRSQCGPSVCQLSYAAYSAADGALPPRSRALVQRIKPFLVSGSLRKQREPLI
ncbi:1-phosphatidylinositol 4,5-bisphosphate phosphodiesterase delta-3-A-like protein [Labeo rohita]|uniref:1-phosphatidylinositol 4,5-bisphosphate phosphodiesterase delta-3-A-like protein n=1 Tax=Labeo rohita TaxID=84645 RepID=A0A498MI34_LABRO|nr:1-phosphatidylinositol 4,5-bisphosphate phosphodiesterase delta-3-A-like protein [Labeo rohita]